MKKVLHINQNLKKTCFFLQISNVKTIRSIIHTRNISNAKQKIKQLKGFGTQLYDMETPGFNNSSGDSPDVKQKIVKRPKKKGEKMALFQRGKQTDEATDDNEDSGDWEEQGAPVQLHTTRKEPRRKEKEIVIEKDHEYVHTKKNMFF